MSGDTLTLFVKKRTGACEIVASAERRRRESSASARFDTAVRFPNPCRFTGPVENWLCKSRTADDLRAKLTADPGLWKPPNFRAIMSVGRMVAGLDGRPELN